VDNLTKEQRRKNMQNIQSTGTKPELTIKKELRKRKIYFAQYVNSLPGKPDFVFRRKKVALFIDSDFWHGNPEKFIMPKTNTDYWKNKIERNKTRDKIITHELQENGWKVIRLWESEIKRNLNDCLIIIMTAIGRS